MKKIFSYIILLCIISACQSGNNDHGHQHQPGDGHFHPEAFVTQDADSIQEVISFPADTSVNTDQ